MSALRLTVREAPAQRLDLSPLVPDRLAGLSAAEIERLPLQTTRVPCCVGDVFRVAAGEAANVVFESGSERFDGVGEAMKSGSLRVEGDVGQRCGRAMTGGTIEVRGHAGPFAASGLRGGVLTIGGDAGDGLGGPLPGERAGMAGGIALVRGSTGVRAGDRLRRGLIVVEGDAGEAAASRMIAGTLVVCGRAGPLAGFMMRRGTLLLSVKPEGGLLPGFLPVAGETGVFRSLLAAALREVSPRAAELAGAAGRRLLGDTASLGRGELLLASGPAGE